MDIENRTSAMVAIYPFGPTLYCLPKLLLRPPLRSDVRKQLLPWNVAKDLAMEKEKGGAVKECGFVLTGRDRSLESGRELRYGYNRGNRKSRAITKTALQRKCVRSLFQNLQSERVIAVCSVKSQMQISSTQQCLF
jgi:hypothetical protein